MTRFWADSKQHALTRASKLGMAIHEQFIDTTKCKVLKATDEVVASGEHTVGEAIIWEASSPPAEWTLAKVQEHFGFTPTEQQCADHLAEAMNCYARAMREDQARQMLPDHVKADDLNEFAVHIHVLQHMVMKQLAHRMYPEKYRP